MIKAIDLKDCSKAKKKDWNVNVIIVAIPGIIKSIISYIDALDIEYVKFIFVIYQTTQNLLCLVVIAQISLNSIIVVLVFNLKCVINLVTKICLKLIQEKVIICNTRINDYWSCQNG